MRCHTRRHRQRTELEVGDRKLFCAHHGRLDCGCANLPNRHVVCIKRHSLLGFSVYLSGSVNTQLEFTIQNRGVNPLATTSPGFAGSIRPLHYCSNSLYIRIERLEIRILTSHEIPRNDSGRLDFTRRGLLFAQDLLSKKERRLQLRLRHLGVQGAEGNDRDEQANSQLAKNKAKPDVAHTIN